VTVPENVFGTRDSKRGSASATGSLIEFVELCDRYLSQTCYKLASIYDCLLPMISTIPVNMVRKGESKQNLESDCQQLLRGYRMTALKKIVIKFFAEEDEYQKKRLKESEGRMCVLRSIKYECATHCMSSTYFVCNKWSATL
jgi:hypothetical protein